MPLFFRVGDRLLRKFDDFFGRKTEMEHQFRGGRGIAETGHSEKFSVVAEIFCPTLFDAQLDADARFDALRQDRFAVFFRLFFEQIPTRRADDSDLNSLRRQDFARLKAKVDFASGSDQNRVGRSFAIGENVRALGGSGRGAEFFAVDRR